MDPKKKHLCADPWSKSSSSSNELLNQICQDQQQQQQRRNSSLSDYDDMIIKQLETSPSLTDQIKFLGQGTSETHDKGKAHVWDPNIMLSNLSIMEEKIHQLQDLVHSIVGRTAESSMAQPNKLLNQQQQLVTTDLTSIIIQLISTAGSLLPLVKHPQFLSSNPSFGNGVNVSTNNTTNNNSNSQSNKDMVNKVEDESNIEIDVHEERESKDEDDVDEGEYLPPGSYEILQLEKEEILAPHTHFCVICGKGFKRDANLRMHMRGHGDEYKTAAALAKPHKERSSEPEPRLIKIKRYSCPYVGCKRNKDHNKFQPLKTILCVKNHYKRTHCDKSYTCSRCNTKKFSVIADLKTHEKHCGRDRWLCSCGTTFSRKDKLFGHIALFQGHTPAIPLDDHGNNNNIQVPKQVGSFDFNFTSNSSNGSGIDPSACFSPFNSNAFQDFPRTLFDDSDPSFSFLSSGSCWKNGGEWSSKDLQ